MPEFLLRYGIKSKVAGRVSSDPEKDELVEYRSDLFDQLNSSEIAIHTDDANEQHYELPSEFFEIILGPRLKYSCCYFETQTSTLAEAEEKMLQMTVERAGVVDGDTILDLGCGWGSLTLFMAEKFPKSSITAISNSSTQKEFINRRAEELGFDNINVITANISEFEFEEQPNFDRILSVEMFEHMRNYQKLLEKLTSWLTSNGTLFVHMFARYGAPYLFESGDQKNFMAKYFFTGGTMLNYEDLPHFLPSQLQLEHSWEVSGTQYSRTLEIWLDRMKNNKETLIPILKDTYGKEFRKWWEYWKIFFIVCSELFNFDNGEEWIVMHYLFKKR